MASLSDEQIRALAHDIAAQALTRMSDEERQGSLRAAIKLWVPTADEFALRELAPKVANCFNQFAVLLDQRKERLTEQGRAAPYA